MRGSSITLKSLQRLMGKCNSFLLAFPATKFNISEMAASVAKASRGGEVKLSPNLREEIVFGGSSMVGTRRLSGEVSVMLPSLLLQTLRLSVGVR